TRLAAALSRVRLVLSRVPSHLKDRAAPTPSDAAAVLAPLAALLGDSAALADVSALAGQ
ncbi:hypothetical protein THAOC_14816, partial [Thalassiosira oceanica]